MDRLLSNDDENESSGLGSVVKGTNNMDLTAPILPRVLRSLPMLSSPLSSFQMQARPLTQPLFQGKTASLITKLKGSRFIRTATGSKQTFR